MDTFTQISLSFSPTTKDVSSATPTDETYTKELAELNKLYKALTGPQSDAKDGVAPPPTVVNPKRSAQISKLRDSGNTAFRAGKYQDAIKMYTLGIDMAAGRPIWEPAVLVREELSSLYANRSQAHIAVQNWAEGSVDGECSVELKKNQNPKGWWRRGKCLFEMGRLAEAERWLEEAIEFEGREADLVELLGEVKEAVARKRS